MAFDITQLHIISALIAGVIIGLLETYYIAHDERNQTGGNVLSDMAHGFGASVIATLVAANTPYILSVLMPNLPQFLIPWLYIDAKGQSLTLSIIIFFMFMSYMVAKRAVIRGLDQVSEKFSHKVIVAALAVFIYPYYIMPIVIAQFPGIAYF